LVISEEEKLTVQQFAAAWRAKIADGIRQGSPEQSDTALSYFITTAKSRGINEPVL